MGADKHLRRKQRSKKKFVQIWHEVIESPAYQSLSVYARAALVELCNRYNGGNNGKISFSVREMAERLDIGKNTACRAMQDLVDRLLAIPTRPGWFSTKHRQATEWRITFQPYNGTPPTNEFRNWRRENVTQPPRKKSLCVPSRGTHGASRRDTTRTAQSPDGPSRSDTTNQLTVPPEGTHVHYSHTPVLTGSEVQCTAMAAMTEVNVAM
jgi:hypothetical protein